MKHNDLTNFFKYIAIILLSISTILVITFGKINFDKKSKQEVTTANEVNTTVQKKTKETSEGKDLSQLKLMDYLVSESKQYGSARISFLGSSLPDNSSIPKEKTWIALLQMDLKENTKGLEQLSYIMKDYDRQTTAQILDGKKVEMISQQVPTVILFETGVLNDYREDIPIQATKSNLEKIMAQFKEKVPNARVILLLPNRGSDIGSNSQGLTPKEYIDQAKEFIQSKTWDYIDLYEGFEKQRLQEGRALTQVLLKDGHTPNVIGNQYIYKTMKEYFVTR
ncbi:hypothetical protein [Tepidibacillus marianensis]|uniref:SGNH/GDSL hydrolase family protein n=1 Tax=Tepidibacillus marianensis TaxID=3131995 RepID=UPI0030D42929